MPIVSNNPATGKIIKEYSELSSSELEAKLTLATECFKTWKETEFVERSKLMKNVAEILRKNKESYGKIITSEMGKVIKASIAEVEKCAWVCDYYAENAEEILVSETIKTEASQSYVRFDPLGIIFAVMPWNFPFWQVFRFAAPALMAGNVGILKHASNVPASALLIEKIFSEAGFPTGAFQTLLVSSSKVAGIIADERIAAVTLTGSENAGIEVAQSAGRALKKSVLELGGSDPFIVLKDADVEQVAINAANARLQNAGQSCIAAKRFIVAKEIATDFTRLFKENVEKLNFGDPQNPATDIGPVISSKAMEELQQQVDQSVKMGAQIVTGGKRKKGEGYFFEPTILSNVTTEMPAFKEETFGPVAAVIVANDDARALELANSSRFGLGSSVWTKDTKRAEVFIKGLEAGSVFVNEIVKSDPRMPFGGIKKSGYGRELADYGIKEFVNVKSVWVK